MTAVTAPPTATEPAAPPAPSPEPVPESVPESVPPVHVRRPRMRRPAHEPEPVDAPACGVAASGGLPGGVATVGTTTGDPAGGDAAASWPAGDAGRAERAVQPGTVPGARRAAPRDEELHRRATALVRAMVEVLAGRRPPAHLAGVARPEVVRYLTAGRVAERAAPAAPGRVHVSRPAHDAAEVVAVCRFGTRFRALTVRLDREPAAGTPIWCATAVRLL